MAGKDSHCILDSKGFGEEEIPSSREFDFGDQITVDGRFIYFSPGFSGDSSKEDTLSSQVIRFDARGEPGCTGGCCAATRWVRTVPSACATATMGTMAGFAPRCRDRVS